MHHIIRKHFWVCPAISSFLGSSTLLIMLLYWMTATHRKIYPSMHQSQTIAFISDIAADKLKPVFATSSIVTSLLFGSSFATYKWTAHFNQVRGPVTSRSVLAGVSVLLTMTGSLGLCLLSIFDVANHIRLHAIFLVVFIGGHLSSAILVCWGSRHSRYHNQIRNIAFWVKVCIVILLICMITVYSTAYFLAIYDVAAVLEWSIGFLYYLYVSTFTIDFHHSAGHID